jgi:hypothetical protein
MIVATTRTRLVDLETISDVSLRHLDPLAEPECVELLRRVGIPTIDDGTAGRIVGAYACHALSITVLAKRFSDLGAEGL